MSFLIIIPLLLVSVTVHEFAHGWVAFLRGDQTAREQGRLTLNPVAHVDLMGMVVVPLVLAFTIGVPFGWAKPVPVNPWRLKKPKTDMIWVALAGPLSNIILALLGVFLLKTGALGQQGLKVEVCTFFILMNLALAMLNMIPIPPLDGSRVVSGLLPRKQAMAYARLEPYGFVIVLALFYFGFVGKWIQTGVHTFLHFWGF